MSGVWLILILSALCALCAADTGFVSTNVSSATFGFVFNGSSYGLVTDNSSSLVLNSPTNSSVYTTVNGQKSTILNDGNGNTIIPGSLSVMGLSSIPGLQSTLIVGSTYGMIGDGVTDNTNAMYAFFRATIMCNQGWGCNGFIPSGHYMFKSPLVFDASLQSGLVISGAGSGVTVLTINATQVPVNAMLFTSASHLVANYMAFRDIGINGYSTQSLIAFGRNGTYPDTFSNIQFQNIALTQLSTYTTSAVLEVNGVYDSVFNIYANCTVSSVCTALILNNMMNCQVSGTFLNAMTGILFPNTTNGVVSTNTFVNLDVNLVYTGVLINSSYATYNTFIGGGVGGSNASLLALAGSHNYFVNTNFLKTPTLSMGTGISAAGGAPFAASMIPYMNAPPATSGTVLSNTSGASTQLCFVSNSGNNGYTAMYINGVATGGAATTALSCIIMKPNDNLYFTFSKPGSQVFTYWSWTPI